MAIGTPSVGAATAAAAATTTAVPFPTTVNAGDVCVLIGSVNSANLVTNPAGWTQVVSFYGTGNTLAPDLFVAWKVAAGTEGGTSVTVTHGNTASNWQIYAFPGADNTTPMDATPVTQDTTTASTTTSIAGITVVTTGAALLYVAAAASTVATSTPPAGFTETLDLGSSTRATTAAYKLGQAPGATGTVANTWSTTQKSIGALLALRPATSAAQTVSPTGIASSETFGAATVALGSAPTQTINPTGLASNEAFGSAALSGGAVTPQLDVDFEDGTTGAFDTVQGATVGAAALDGTKSARLAPDGSGFAALVYNLASGVQTHSWWALRMLWRPVVKTSETGNFGSNVLFEVFNTLTSGLKGQFTMYTQGGNLGVDFNTTDFSTILASYTTGQKHLIEVRCYYGATTYTAYVRIDGTEYVHTSANTQTPAFVRALSIKYAGNVTDDTNDVDDIRFWYGDTDPGYLPPAANQAQTFYPTGIASSEGTGTATVSPGATILTPTGIASGETAGSPTVAPGPVTIAGSGISSAETVGAPTITIGPVATRPVGVSSAEAFGAATVTPGPVTLTVPAVVTAEQFGVATLSSAASQPARDLTITGSIGAPHWTARLGVSRWAGTIGTG